MNDSEMEQLITRLQAPSTGERMQAIQALGKSRDTRAIQPLIGVLSDKAVILRTAVVIALTGIGEPATDALIMALHDDDDLLRTGAAKILGAIGGTRVSQALQIALRDDNNRVRALAAEGLGTIGDVAAVDVLLGALHDVDKQVVVRAVTALGKLRAVEAVEPLIRLVMTHHDMLRHMAVWALGQIGDARAVPAILQALVEDCQTHAIDLGTTDSDFIGRLGGHDAAGDANRADVEVAALAKIGQPALVPLLSILPKVKPSVRVYALMCIAQIDPAEGLIASTIALDDSDPLVRHVASQLHRRLSPPQD